MKLILHDTDKWLRFAPLTFTRPVAELRVGILTNTERWKLLLPETEVFYETEKYLAKKFPATANPDIEINACCIPDKKLGEKITALSDNSQLEFQGTWIAKKGNASHKIELEEAPLLLEERWHLFQLNDKALQNDFDLLTQERNSALLSNTNTIIGDERQVFVEEEATVEAAMLNTTSGPIYIGKNATIMEGALIRGGLALCEKATVKMGAKIYGATTIGPHCKVGGEVNNCIFQGYSNKGHDGFLGNSLIGEWCNLGADTNTSNLKNNYGKVSTHSFVENKFVQTEEQFIGLTMGDHSKCGINTMFNTATVVGVSSNVFGAEFPPKYIPSFSWGGTEFVPFKFEKAIESSNNMMQRRGKKLSAEEIVILQYISDRK